MFGNEGNPQPPPGAPSSPPVDKVVQMRQQGMSNNQIIQTLQNQGYDSSVLFDALNQADIKGGVEAFPATQNDFKPDDLQNPMQMPSTPPPMESPPPMDSGAESGSLGRIEEIAEAIIDEKWNEIVKSINKIVDWKDRTESKITRIEQQMNDMKSDFDNLTKGVLGKIGEYDQNLTNIGAEIKAMDKVFQKVLPSLTENVHALDRITKGMKKG